MIKLSTWLKISCIVLSTRTFAADFGATEPSNPPSEANHRMDLKIRPLPNRPIIRDGLRENRRQTNLPDVDIRPIH
jgi:hypothetical protein